MLIALSFLLTTPISGNLPSSNARTMEMRTITTPPRIGGSGGPEPYPQLISTRYTSREGLPAGEAHALRFAAGRLYVETTHGVALFDGRQWRALGNGAGLPAEPSAPDTTGLPPGAVTTSWARTRSGETWVMTTKGAFRRAGDRWMPLDLPRLYRPHQPQPDIDTQIRVLAADDAGHVWIAGNLGLSVTDGADWWHPINREDGMPFEEMLCVAIAPNGDVWGGTSQGAWRLRMGQFRAFWGRRWLPGNRVNAIVIDAEGAAWLATDGGVAKIEERKTTLAQKANHYEQVVAARHVRDGYVTRCGLKRPGDTQGGILPEASDNDGLWTALYVGAETFRYATTHDPQARALAKRSLNALLDLVRLSGYPGFPARALIHRGETVSGYDPNETVRVPGETDKIWYASPSHPNILCKGDTSSDELDGHYFAWYIFYDLAADEEERRAIREVVRAVTDNILQHGDTLVGPTGRKTRWGVWGPQFLNDDPRWWDERGLNSLELLCYLKVAAHICGDPRYRAAYDDLIERHHYLLNTLEFRRGLPWYAIDHSDDELAFLVYYPLLKLEDDPHRRAIVLQSLGSVWRDTRVEQSPLFDFVYGATTGMPCDVEEAVATLQDWPWELIDWEVRNSSRDDVTLRTAQGIHRTEADRVLPAGERPLMRWNGNPYELDGGNGGQSEEDGTAWLLPYWMGRYHKLIGE